MGANVMLGPGLSLARLPHNGRNFEYLSGEDPYLGQELAGPTVRGIQSQGVIANAKHYVDNSQEIGRSGVTEVVDERTQWELYYLPFKGAVDAGVLSVMCSYNKVQITPGQTEGLYSCENPESLRALKDPDKMNFTGFIISDWYAVRIAMRMSHQLNDELYNKQVRDALLGVAHVQPQSRPGH